MTAPQVYRAIVNVATELARKGVAKQQTNDVEGYQFRGIDDIYNALGPLLAQHGLCVLPCMVERQSAERVGSDGKLLLSVTIKAALTFVSAEDGSTHAVESYGEALDQGDKASSKAMSAAYKYAMLQTFCIPVDVPDADRQSYTLRNTSEPEVPIQGWEQWSVDIRDIALGCETNDALDLLQSRNRALLKRLAREQQQLYQTIGDTIRARRDALIRVKRLIQPKKAAKRRVASPTEAVNGASHV